MTRQIVLSETEYHKLITEQNEPSQTLIDANKKFKAQLQTIKNTKQKNIIVHINSPFKIENGTLNFSTEIAFIQMYNYFLLQQHAPDRPTVKQADIDIFNYLTQLCTIYAYKMVYTSIADVRNYRLKIIKF